MLFLRGLILGFSIAAPVGPIGVLVIRRSMRDGWLSGFISGLGAASADMLYGSVAAFGLQAVSDFLIHKQIWLRLAGGVFLIYLGMRTFLKEETAERQAPENRTDGLANYSSTFLLTLTNPLTILSFAAIFASVIPVSMELSTQNAVQMVIGVFVGSSLWWLILGLGSAALNTRLNRKTNRWIQWVSGGIILCFGVAALWTVFF
jgi:threonine/homoserine/homoserine lactone efflux protein